MLVREGGTELFSCASLLLGIMKRAPTSPAWLMDGWCLQERGDPANKRQATAGLGMVGLACGGGPVWARVGKSTDLALRDPPNWAGPTPDGIHAQSGPPPEGPTPRRAHPQMDPPPEGPTPCTIPEIASIRMCTSQFHGSAPAYRA